jgi:hypothetical protein
MGFHPKMMLIAVIVLVLGTISAMAATCRQWAHRGVTVKKSGASGNSNSRDREAITAR